MGRIRNLTTDEILVQMFYAKKVVRLSRSREDGSRELLLRDGVGRRMRPLPDISNVVFMGMGEPADNPRAVCEAEEVLTRDGDGGCGLTGSRVTVSTVAPSPDAFLEFANAQCVLAWSVHTARDELRRELVPTTRYDMEELRGGLIDALQRKVVKTCMIEVALMDGINDSPREAYELAEFVRVVTDEAPGSKVVCNLIPYKDVGGGGTGGTLYRTPPIDRVVAFQKRLQERGVYAHVRGTRGDKELAACGQLATGMRRRNEAREREAVAVI
ncbi:hypothetical protein ACHAWF_003813 [Thalassiosira exigua]